MISTILNIFLFNFSSENIQNLKNLCSCLTLTKHTESNRLGHDVEKKRVVNCEVPSLDSMRQE